MKNFISALSASSVPLHHSQALVDSNWMQAMRDEMDALWSRGTWDLVDPPTDADIVGCKWVYSIKYNSDGSIERYKARLVAKGYTQTYGVDFFETFSPVARLGTIRLVLSVAVHHGWPLFQLDVKNAFLYGDLHETVYMQQPPGFEVQGECQKVCKLKKAIYGLKQSPRAWFHKLFEVMSSFGFVRSASDHSLFIKKTSTGIVVMVVYVDDIILTGSSAQDISATKDHLQKHFVTKDLGHLRYFLGIEVARNKEGLVLSQRKYVLDLLKETGMLGAKPANIPMDPKTHMFDEKSEYVDSASFRSLVGKLLYVTVTRPDISLAVSKISQFMDKPTKVHWDAAMMVLRYLKSSPGKGLLFKRNPSLDVVAYTDADYAGSVEDRKSTSGFCVFVGGNLVTWRSKKQTVVARSSAESEYRAMAQTAAEIMWVKSVLTELQEKVSLPMLMMCDNRAATYIANNPVFHERTKHIEVDCHYVRDLVQAGYICTDHVSSEDQVADVFTKALARPNFSKCCDKLSMIDIYAPA